MQIGKAAGEWRPGRERERQLELSARFDLILAKTDFRLTSQRMIPLYTAGKVISKCGWISRLCAHRNFINIHARYITHVTWSRL